MTEGSSGGRWRKFRLLVRGLCAWVVDRLGMRKRILRLVDRFNTVVAERRLRLAVRRQPLLIVVGASGVSQAGWTATEANFLELLKVDDWERYFSKHKIDAIVAEHVWEHLTPEDGLKAATNCARYLKPWGRLRIAVPDGNHPDPAYIDYVKPGGSGYGADDHKALYNYRRLSEMLARAGFDVQLLEYFDDDQKFVARPWDPKDGMILRSARYDERNRDGKLAYTSVIADAYRR
jgi:predicted SAM-dependent methyltransferase